jgi:hypothetical protein
MRVTNRTHYQRGNITITKIAIRGFPKEIFPCESKGGQPWKPIQNELKKERERLYQAAVELFEQYRRQPDDANLPLQQGSPDPPPLPEMPDPVDELFESSACNPISEFQPRWFFDDPDINPC